MSYVTSSGKPRIGKIVGHVLLGIIVLTVFFGSFVVVSAGERGVVLQLGKVVGVMDNGFHFKIPFVQHVQTLTVQTQKEQIDATAASQDLQDVTTTFAVNYNLKPNEVGQLWQNIGENYKTRIIDPYIQESIKATTAKYTAEQLVTQRERVVQDVQALLSQRLDPEFITVTQVSIVNFKFSGQFEQAIEAKVTAEQNALAAKNKLEQVKYEADQRVAAANGEAKAIAIQAQAITSQGGKEYVNLKWVEKWNGQLPTTMLGSNTPLVSIGQ